MVTIWNQSQAVNCDATGDVPREVLSVEITFSIVSPELPELMRHGQLTQHGHTLQADLRFLPVLLRV